MPPARDPDLAVGRITAAVLQRVPSARPGDLSLASRTLARLTPERWALEWHLPWWVGRAFGLGADRAEALVMGNLLGLLALRLEDDLRDGELETADVEAARRLMPRLLAEALATWRAELPGASPFWSFVSGALDAWRSAQAEPAHGDGKDLVSRAAPVRIPGYGLCLLMDRLDAWPALDQCLGHALTALVRDDQIADWEDDLAAGRWNTFVAALSPGRQDPASRDRNAARVRVALLTASAATHEYGRIEAEAMAAADVAAELGIEPLAGFLADYASRTAVQGAAVQRHYDEVATRATVRMFGSLARV